MSSNDDISYRHVPSHFPVVDLVMATLSKYTAFLDPTTAAAFDEVALLVRRDLGQRVLKSDLLRILIMRLLADADLRRHVVNEMKARRPAEPEAVA